MNRVGFLKSFFKSLQLFSLNDRRKTSQTVTPLLMAILLHGILTVQAAQAKSIQLFTNENQPLIQSLSESYDVLRVSPSLISINRKLSKFNLTLVTEPHSGTDAGEDQSQVIVSKYHPGSENADSSSYVVAGPRVPGKIQQILELPSGRVEIRYRSRDCRKGIVMLEDVDLFGRQLRASQECVSRN
jgi:hypothetical protein